MTNIFRQVDEDLRKEKLNSLWRKYGVYIVIILLLIISIVIGNQIRKSINISQNEEIVKKYLEATNTTNINDSQNLLIQFIDTTDHYVGSLSKLNIANNYYAESEIESSNQILISLIEDKNNDVLIQDLAVYLYLMSNLEKLKVNEFEDYLTEERKNSSRFKNLYKELIGIKNYLNGEKVISINIFQEIKNDVNSSVELRNRVNRYIELID